MRGNRCGCRGRCNCEKKIVYPTREEVKNRYTEETVNHIFPTHTTVVNNHTIRNVYSYPHSTSYETRVREVDVRGGAGGPGVMGAFEGPGGNVRGAFQGGRGCGCRGRCSCSGRRRGSWW